MTSTARTRTRETPADRQKRVWNKSAPGYDKQIAFFEKIWFGGGREWVGERARDRAGPLAIMGAMTVASVTHRASGPLAANRGFELPLTNLAAAAALAATGPGRLRLSPPLSRRLTTVAAAGGALLAAGSPARMLTAAREQASEGRLATSAEPAPDAARNSASDANTEPGTSRP
jgi:hypothetical protein